MSTHTKFYSLLFFLLAGLIFPGQQKAIAADSLILYTPYTKISVPPGESLEFSIDFINKGDALVNTEVSVTGMPKGWDYLIKTGNWNIRQVSILPEEKKSLVLQVEVPLRVNKGDYPFKVMAKGFGTLPIVVNVSERGTFKTEFTADQANMEGHAQSNFTFKANLRNRTADKQLYSLRSDVPRGWRVTFKPNYQQATSVEVEANNSVDVSIEVKPPATVEAGTYKIPVLAATKGSSTDLELEVVITGTFDMELTTPTGLLSTSITAGKEKRVELMVKNTGSSELRDIDFTAAAPVNWEVVFDPRKIDVLEAGGEARTMATIKAGEKAISGDYATTITAKTPEVTSKASFRISVKTPMLWGWIGVFIIVIALGSVYYMFRKYGRR